MQPTQEVSTTTVNEGRVIVGLLLTAAVAFALAIMVWSEDPRTAGMAAMSCLFFVGAFSLWAILGPKGDPRRLFVIVAVLLAIRLVLVPHAKSVGPADAFDRLLLTPVGFAACLLPLRMAGFRITHVADGATMRPSHTFSLMYLFEWTLTVPTVFGILWFLGIPVVARDLAQNLLFMLWLGLCLSGAAWLVLSADWYQRASLTLGAILAVGLLVLCLLRVEDLGYLILIVPFAVILIPGRIAGFRLDWGT